MVWPHSESSFCLTYSRFLELGPTPGCSACENDRSNHSPECVARFEKAFGRPEEGGSAASAPLPDPEAFLSFEHFDVPDVVPRADEDDFVERAAADITAGIEPARRIADDEHYEPNFAGDYDDPLDDFEEEGADRSPRINRKAETKSAQLQDVPLMAHWSVNPGPHGRVSRPQSTLSTYKGWKKKENSQANCAQSPSLGSGVEISGITETVRQKARSQG